MRPFCQAYKYDLSSSGKLTAIFNFIVKSKKKMKKNERKRSKEKMSETKSLKVEMSEINTDGNEE